MNRHDLLNKLNSLKLGITLLKKDLPKEKKEKLIKEMEKEINNLIYNIK
ncbi:MAG: hypothetical protein GXO62_07765 [Epsilonproteobacteria bacterium]|nr:hypothetical protein [Campylobacterota bacterium]